MKYYIIAGEASGDLHASNLMYALRQKDENAVFRCWGGDLMEAAGGQLVKHYRDLAFMGFTEVVLNLRTILNNISFCKKDILQFQPDLLILIDYPGFNLRIADFAHQKQLKVFYYIAPQVWAWHTSRVKKMKLHINQLFVILPFGNYAWFFKSSSSLHGKITNSTIPCPCRCCTCSMSLPRNGFRPYNKTDRNFFCSWE